MLSALPYPPLWERTLPIPHAPTARSCLRLPPKALFLRARPLLRRAAVLALLNLAVVPAVTVGVPLLVVRYYAFSDTALAITQSAMSAGGLLGGVLAGAFAKRLSLRRGTAALWCITAVCALLGLAVLPCVPAAAGYIAVTSLAFLHDGYRRTVSDSVVYCNSVPCPPPGRQAAL